MIARIGMSASRVAPRVAAKDKSSARSPVTVELISAVRKRPAPEVFRGRSLAIDRLAAYHVVNEVVDLGRTHLSEAGRNAGTAADGAKADNADLNGSSRWPRAAAILFLMLFLVMLFLVLTLLGFDVIAL